MLGAFFIKAGAYYNVEENSHYNDSYWYSVEHVSEKKSFFNTIYGNLFTPPYVDGHAVCHADEMFYIFNRNMPIVLCNTNQLVGKIIWLNT